jgi:hypothetical protein
LGAGWGQLDEAVRQATSMGWIEGRGPDSVALLPEGMEEAAPAEVPTKPLTPDSAATHEWPTALRIDATCRGRSRLFLRREHKEDHMKRYAIAAATALSVALGAQALAQNVAVEVAPDQRTIIKEYVVKEKCAR